MALKSKYTHQQGEISTILGISPRDENGDPLGFTAGDLAGSAWTLEMELRDSKGVLVAALPSNPKVVTNFSSDGNSWQAFWLGSETGVLTPGHYSWKLTAENLALSPVRKVIDCTTLVITRC